MKRIQLFSAAFTAAMLFTSSALFAQLKVGTNPTTIGANSNLEVEASTAGRKLTVDKTSGKLTVADGTQAAGKILTSDAAGGASWQTPTAATVGLGQLRTTIQGYGSGVTFHSTFLYAGVDFNSIPGAAVDGPNGVISLPAGTYRISVSVSITFGGGNNPANQADVALLINGVGYQILGSQCVPASNTFVTYGGSSVFTLAAAGQISLYGGAQTGGGFTIHQGGYYSSCTLEKIQ